jgi:hypothetical protein
MPNEAHYLARWTEEKLQDTPKRNLQNLLANAQRLGYNNVAFRVQSVLDGHDIRQAKAQATRFARHLSESLGEEIYAEAEIRHSDREVHAEYNGRVARRTYGTPRIAQSIANHLRRHVIEVRKDRKRRLAGLVAELRPVREHEREVSRDNVALIHEHARTYYVRP